MDYGELASDERIQKTITALAERHIEASVVEDRAEALARIKELIPSGASVMNGASVTLEEIGFVEYLKSGTHPWNNLHAGILAEKDPAKQSRLRKEAALSDYYLGSVHALAENGQFLVASNTGSQLPHVVFTSPNLVFVVGAQKIVPDLPSAFDRLETYVIPREEKHMQELYNSHTFPSKIVIFNRENPNVKRSVKMLLVKEKLGF
jgi:hypothetical protein